MEEVEDGCIWEDRTQESRRWSRRGNHQWDSCQALQLNVWWMHIRIPLLENFLGLRRMFMQESLYGTNVYIQKSVKNEGCSPLNIPVMSLRPLRTKKRFFPIRSLPWNPIPSPPFPCSKGMPLIHASTAATPCTPASTPWDPKITYTENHLRPMNLSISIMGSGRSRGLKWSLVIWAPLVSRRLKHWNFSACPWLNF